MISRVKNMPLKLALLSGRALVANPVKDVGGGVDLYRCTRGHEDQSEDAEEKRNGQSFKAAKDVEDFSEGRFHDARCDVGNNADDGNERMETEGTGDVWQKLAGSLLLHRIDKVNEENTTSAPFSDICTRHRGQ